MLQAIHLLGPSNLAEPLMWEVSVLEKVDTLSHPPGHVEFVVKSQGTITAQVSEGFLARKAMSSFMDNYTSFYLFYQFRTLILKAIYIVSY